MDNTKTLETERLLLRKFTIDDAQGMYDNWATDPEVNKYLGWKLHENVEETIKLPRNLKDINNKLPKKAIEVKYRDEEMLILQTTIKELNIKLGKEQNKIYLLKQRLIHNINKIDVKLKNTKNPYDDPTIDVRKARLRAIKTKCKEILRWLDE